MAVRQIPFLWERTMSGRAKDEWKKDSFNWIVNETDERTENAMFTTRKIRADWLRAPASIAALQPQLQVTAST